MVAKPNVPKAPAIPMKVRDIAITEATRNQLMTYAVNQLGLEVLPTATREELVAKISQANANNTISVEEPDVQMSDQKAVARTMFVQGERVIVGAGTAYKQDPIVVLIAAASEEPGGDLPIELSVNGVAMLLPRGRLCGVPWRYYVALRNAKKTVYSLANVEGDLDQGREIPAYQHDVKQFPDKALLDQWHVDDEAGKHDNNRLAA